MCRKFQRALTVFLIVYAATFYGGMAEFIPMVNSIHQLATALAFGVWIFSLWRSGRGWPTTPLDGPLWLLLAASVGSAALSRDPRVSLEYTWNYFVLTLTFYFFVDQIRQGRRRWILEGIFVFAGVFVLISVGEILGWYFGWPIYSASGIGWPEVTGIDIPPSLPHIASPLNSENRAAATGIVLFPILVGWALTSRRKDVRLGFRWLAVGTLLVILLTQSRGGLLGLGAMVLALAGVASSRLLSVRGRLLLRHSSAVFVASSLLALLGVTASAMAMVGLSASEIARTDLWLSAIRMFEDHLVLGVGPFEFGSSTYWYPNWDRPVGLAGIHHAHNLTLHLLAEGGIVTFTLVTALVIRTFRQWWRRWHLARPALRLRLQAIALMIVGFAAHSTVDYFGTMRPLVIVLAMIAIVISPFRSDKEASQRSYFTRSRVLLAFGTLTLILAQLGFVPILRGRWAHQKAAGYLAAGDHERALSAIKAAQHADPWFDLYALEEAYILGLAAHESPDTYLSLAIESHKAALERNSVWDLGWHNLASLYKEKGDFRAAITAEQRAISIHPQNPQYHFQLGVYFLGAEDIDSASRSLFRALKFSPSLAASDFWTDPDAPERAAILDDALAYYSDDPKTGTDLAMFAGNVELGTQLQKQVIDLSTAANKVNYEAAWGESACLSCFYLPANQHLLNAESILQSKNASEYAEVAEKEAKTALFISRGRDVWAYYTLARLNLDNNPREVNELLFRAVPQPPAPCPRFSAVFYGVSSFVRTLPQARTPVVRRYAYEPWLVLGERLQAAQDWEAALQLYELILDLDPYDRTAQQQVALLTERITSSRSQSSAATPASES